jgi:uncharacterized membrane protein
MEPSIADPFVPQAPRPAAAASVILAALLLIAGMIVFLWFAPASYQIYLALHVIAVVIWVGGDVTLTTLGIVFERRSDGETLAALGRMGGWIGTRVYTPVLFAAFGLGVALVEKGNWGWSTFWIDFAIGGWGVAAAVGVGFVGPELGRIDRAAATHGPDSPEVFRRVKRLFTIFRFDTALLILIVLDMTAKPSF